MDRRSRRQRRAAGITSARYPGISDPILPAPRRSLGFAADRNRRRHTPRRAVRKPWRPADAPERNTSSRYPRPAGGSAALTSAPTTDPTPRITRIAVYPPVASNSAPAATGAVTPASPHAVKTRAKTAVVCSAP
jgi:hypothetical protein